MIEDFHKDVAITNKGQLTLPARIRSALKLGARRKVRVAIADGVVTITPLPDVMSFFGKFKSDRPYEPHEKRAARRAIARRTSQRD